MKPPAAVLGIGDNVEFHGLTYNVTSFDGDIAMLAASGEAPVAVRITALLADATFRILGSAPVRRRIASCTAPSSGRPPSRADQIAAAYRRAAIKCQV